MMAEQTFITTSGVAKMLGLRNAAAFLRQRERLEADHEFPMPMPQIRRPLVWRHDEVAAWIELQGTPRPAQQSIDPRGGTGRDNVVLLAKARTA